MKFAFKKKYIYIFFIILLISLFVWYCYLYFQIEDKNFELEVKNKLQQKKIDEISKLNEKMKTEKLFLSSIDLKKDLSLNKFVSAKVSFNNKSYIPENLVNISSKFIIDWKWWWQKLRKEAFQALEKMGEQYYKDTWNKIVVVSAYRSYLYQKGIKDRWCPDNLCAKAWYSEHQTGLTVDLWSASSLEFWQKKEFIDRYIWLKDNAYKYGYHNTYQKWLEVDTYEIEPWHWRYLWKPLAKYLWENNLTFAEFYNKMEQH